jgi:hypothetical protein
MYTKTLRVGCNCYTPLAAFGLLRCSFLSCSHWTKSPAFGHPFYNTDMDPEIENQPTKSSPKNGANDLVGSMSKFSLNDEHDENDLTLNKGNTEQPARLLVIYPRPQMLKLSKSPLVKLPGGMPTLKDWFGYGFHHKCGHSRQQAQN